MCLLPGQGTTSLLFNSCWQAESLMNWIKRVLLQPCPFYVRRHNDIGLVTAGKETAGTGMQDAWFCLSAVLLPLKLEEGKVFWNHPVSLPTFLLCTVYGESHVTSFLGWFSSLKASSPMLVGIPLNLFPVCSSAMVNVLVLTGWLEGPMHLLGGWVPC